MLSFLKESYNFMVFDKQNFKKKMKIDQRLCKSLASLKLGLSLLGPYRMISPSLSRIFNASRTYSSVAFSPIYSFRSVSILKPSMVEFFMYLEGLALIISIETSLILFIFLLLEEVFPVTITSISISPVVGSVAAC